MTWLRSGKGTVVCSISWRSAGKTLTAEYSIATSYGCRFNVYYFHHISRQLTRKSFQMCYWKFGSCEIHPRQSRKAVLSLILTISEQNLLMWCIVWLGAIHGHSLEISFPRGGANWVQSTCIDDRVGKLCFPFIVEISEQNLLMWCNVWRGAIHDHSLVISLARNSASDVINDRVGKLCFPIIVIIGKRTFLIFFWVITRRKQRSFIFLR